MKSNLEGREKKEIGEREEKERQEEEGIALKHFQQREDMCKQSCPPSLNYWSDEEVSEMLGISLLLDHVD